MSTVAGRRLTRSHADFERSCEVLILDEQEKIAPYNALIAVLCDAVRLSREHCDAATGAPAAHAPADIDALTAEVRSLRARLAATEADGAGMREAWATLKEGDVHGNCGLRSASLGSAGGYIILQPCTCGRHERMTAARAVLDSLSRSPAHAAGEPEQHAAPTNGDDR